MNTITPPSRSLIFEELETRLLFSADGVEALVVDAAIEQDVEEESVVSSEEEAEIQQEQVAADNASESSEETEENSNLELLANEEVEIGEEETAEALTTEDEELSVDVEETEQSETVSESITEVVFVNSDIADSDEIIEDILGQDESDVVLVILDADQDGVEQISDVLAEYENLDAVHFISHGTEGQINLGETLLTNDSLGEYADAIEQWGESLSEEGDILFYECNLAGDSAGKELLNSIAELTGADVAASDDLTGHELLNGDWDLEYQIGSIESSSPLSEDLQSDWEHLLNELVFQNGANGTSQDTFLDNESTGTDNSGNSISVFSEDPFFGSEDIHQGILRFDDLIGVGAAQIANGSDIDSAYLELTILNTSSDINVTMYKVTEDWDDSRNWSDGTPAYDSSTGVAISTTTTGTLQIDVLTVLQDWSTNGSNYGWIFIAEDANNSFFSAPGNDPWVFSNSDDPTATNRPKLTVNFSPPGDFVDVGPVTDSDVATNVVAEDAASGNTVGITASASDTDIGATVTYSLSDDAGGRFAIDANTGVVMVAGTLGYDTASQHNITVLATSTDTSTSSVTFTIQVAKAVSFQNDLAGVTYTGTEDTYVDSDNSDGGWGDPDSDDLSFGDETSVNIEYDDGFLGSDDVVRGLIQFNDLFGTDTSQIPVDSIIVSASLRLYVTDTSEHEIKVYETGQDWSESSTWNQLGAGPDLTGNVLTTIPSGGNTGYITIANLEASLQHWLDGTGTTNNGWVFVDDTNGNDSIWAFASSEHGTESWRPELIVSYIPPNTAPEITGVIAGQTVDDDATIAPFSNVTLEDADTPAQNLSVSVSFDEANGVFSTLNGFSDAGGGVYTYSGTATDATTAIRGLVFNPTENHVAVGSTETTTFSITVNDGVAADVANTTTTVVSTSINDAPQLDTVGTLTLPEDLATGAALINMADGGDDFDVDGDALTYSITGGNTDNVFSIDSATGVITLANALDYETTTSYSLTVQADDEHGLSNSTDSTTITITVTNVNDNTPVITSNGGGATASVTVNENETAVTTVTATDADNDTLTYSITGGVDGSLFQMDGSGNLSFIAAPDYESPGDSGTDNLYNVQVSVFDGTNTTSQDIIITVIGVNDNAPVFTNPSIHTIPENYSGAYQLTASDADFPTEAPVFSVAGTGDDDALFSMTASGLGSFLVSPDFENPADSNGDNTYILDVQVSDGVHVTVQRILITISNLNDNAPQIDDTTVTLAEDSGNSTEVIDINESLTNSDVDLDGDSLNYYISSGNIDNIFSIDAASGVISVLDDSLLDYESRQQYSLIVQVNDGLNSDTAEVTIDIANVNDNSPLIEDATVALAEDAVDGTEVTNINDANTADDIDLDGESLNYSILSGNTDGIFSIDSAGVISVLNNSNLDYETTQQYVLEVEASDGTYSDRALITIDVSNVNDNSPLIDNTDIDIQEDVANGFVVTNINDQNTGNDTDGDGDVLAYTITDGNTDNIFSIDSNGIIVVSDNSNLDYEATIQYVLTVQASDGSRSDTAEITVNVQNVNDNSPQISPITTSLAENAANGFVVSDVNEMNTGNDTDLDGQSLTYTIINGNSDGIFTIQVNGEITVSDNSNLDHETEQQYVLTVQVSDGLYTDDTQVTINVTNINDVGPDIIDTAVNLVETAANGTIVTNINDSLTGLDTDIEGDAIHYSIVSGNGDGVFAINSNTGEITVFDNTTVDYDLGVHSYVLGVMAIDSNDGSITDSAQLTINVVAENDNAPQIDAQTVTVSENAANATIIANVNDASGGDTDLDGDALIYSIIGGNDDGVFAIDAGSGEISVVDNSTLDYETTTQYVLTIQADDTQYTDTAQITVQVDNENDNPPYIVDAVRDIPENTADGTVVINVNDTNTGNDTDLDGDVLAYRIVDGNIGGTFTINATGEISVLNSASLDYEITQQYELQIEASDGTQTDTALITIDVTNLNDNSPLVVDTTTTLLEDAADDTLVLDINDANNGTDLDLDGDSIAYEITAGNVDDVFSINGAGQIIVADSSNLDFETLGQYVLTISAADGVFTDSAQITVDIVNINDNGPLIDAVVTTVAENVANNTIVVDLNDSNTGNDTDLDGDALTYSITAGDGDNIFSVTAAGQVVVTDNTNLDFETTQQYILTVSASDGTFSDTSQVTVNVTNINDTSPLVDAVVTNIAENAANGTIVADINDSNTGNDTDLDGDALTYSITAGNGDNIFSVTANGQIVVTDNTNLDFETTQQYTLTVSASDGTFSGTAQVTVNVDNINDNSPQLASVTVVLSEDAANGVSLIDMDDVAGGDTDRDSDPLYYTISGGNEDNVFAITPYTGEISVANNSNLDFETTPQYALTILAEDGVFSDTAQVTVNVTNVNDNSPLIDDVVTSIAEDAAVGATVTNINDVNTGNDMDPDGDTLMYSITAGNVDNIFSIDAAGQIVVADNSRLDFEATSRYVLTILAEDGAFSDTAQVTVNVTNVNDNSPLIVDLVTSIAEDAVAGAVVTNINDANTGNDMDLDGDAISYSIVDGNSSGIFAINNSGEITLLNNSNLDYETVQQYELTIEATDTVFDNFATVTINITPVNDNAPVITSGDVVTVMENSTMVQQITADDADLPGDSLTYSLFGTGNDNDFFTIDSSGNIRFTVAPDFENPVDEESDNVYILNVQVDDALHITTQRLTVTVADVNEYRVGNTTDTNTASNSVAENVSVGAGVGITGLAADEDGSDIIAYTLSSDGGGLFAIDSTTGVITVASGTLDFEDTNSYTITVLSTSTDNSTSSQDFTIAITDVDESVTEPGEEEEESGGETPVEEPPIEEPVVEEPVEDEEEDGLLPGDETDDDGNDNSDDESSADVTVDGSSIVEPMEEELILSGGSQHNMGAMTVDILPSLSFRELLEEDYLLTAPIKVTAAPTVENIAVLMLQDIDDPLIQNLQLGPAQDFDFSSLDALAVNPELQREVDAFLDDFDSAYEEVALHDIYTARLITGTSLSLSVGVVSYLLRGGALMSSLLSSMPLWKSFDPVGILLLPKKKRKKKKDAATSEAKSQDTAEQMFDRSDT